MYKNRTQEGGNFDGGREVRENQNWPINQSGSGIRGTEVAGESGTSDLYDGGEGDFTGKSGETFQGGDYSVEYDDEFDHYVGRPTKDSGGNEISGETAKKLAGTTVVDRNNIRRSLGIIDSVIVLSIGYATQYATQINSCEFSSFCGLISK